MNVSEVDASYTLWKERPNQKEQTRSDNLRRYRAIREALIQGYQGELHGRGVQRLTTLAALISGMVGGKSTQLPHIATKDPDGTKPESRVKRFTRWLDNDRILEEGYFLPYAALLLRHLALETLVVVMDGSVVGRGCLALMIHVVYKGRALPLAWRVRHSPKGHCPEALHIEVVALMSRRSRGGAGGLAGRWLCDGTARRTLRARGWSHGCRGHAHNGDGTATRCAWLPWGLAEARPPKRVLIHVPAMRHGSGCWWPRGEEAVFGQHDGDSGSGLSGIQRVTSRPCSLKPVEASLCIRRLSPMSSAGRGGECRVRALSGGSLEAL
jgi:hypothetical protein